MSRKKKAMPASEPTHENYLEALKRSGYLMESRLVKALNEMGFFVDPNQCLLDKQTGKSREIDIVAEYFDGRVRDICVKTLFTIEAINNIHPLVLITKRESSPSADIENYIRCITTPAEYFQGDVYLTIDQEKGATNTNIYSQYATFATKNNGELFACHSDDLYSSFGKLSAFIDAELEKWKDRTDKYKRIFFFQPIMVLASNLMLLTEASSGEYQFKSTSHAKFEFNYHRDESPTSLLIDIITEDYLVEYMNKSFRADERIFEYATKSTKRKRRRQS
jgi:hypothetical protein